MTNPSASSLYRDMTWDEIAAAARADIPIAIPIGSTEQHGHHLPVCTDWVIPERILQEASRQCDLIVGPFIPFGYRSRPGSGGGQHFPGTISLRATTFISLLEDVLNEIKRCGFRNIVLYNWHYENSGFIYEPAYLVAEQNPELKIVVIEDANPDFTADRQKMIWPEGFPGLALEHAAVIETSLMMYHEPSAVRQDRIVPDAPQRVVNHDVLPIDTRMSTASGVLSSPLAASTKKGRLLTEWMVERLIRILAEEFADRSGRVVRVPSQSAAMS
jgi:creatinine amidohydrolase